MVNPSGPSHFTRKSMRSVLWLVAAALLGAAVVTVYFLATGDDGGEASGPTIGDVTAERRQAVERRSSLPAADETEIEPAPDFALPTLAGDRVGLADYEGQVVLVNFWATWCAPCRIEIPDLIEMQSELGDEGVQVLGISLDHQGPEIVQEYADEVGFNYPILLDEGEVANQFGGVYALPTTIIIDREGMIRRRIPGLVTKRLLTPILQELARE